jgi:hypothetical protein
MIGPAEMPLIRPSRANAGITCSVRAAMGSAAAAMAKPPSMTARCRPVRSATMPPSGTDTPPSQRNRLVAEPAAASVQPRSVSMAVPKPNTMPSAAL